MLHSQRLYVIKEFSKHKCFLLLHKVLFPGETLLIINVKAKCLSGGQPDRTTDKAEVSACLVGTPQICRKTLNSQLFKKKQQHTDKKQTYRKIGIFTALMLKIFWSEDSLKVPNRFLCLWIPCFSPQQVPNMA
uniref:Uncharacterized protein n=1 Tax=Sphaerodactylus townsendi TaxID=933632 RepID=A0ACB8EEH5_9SAUR